MRSSSSPRAVSITTGIGAAWRSRRQTSSPSSTGSIRSSTTRSGSVSRAIGQAGGAVLGELDLEALALEVAGHDLREGGVVVDHEHAGRAIRSVGRGRRAVVHRKSATLAHRSLVAALGTRVSRFVSAARLFREPLAVGRSRSRTRVRRFAPDADSRAPSWSWPRPLCRAG